ncbi:beta-lactamase family protein [Tardiphaga robiniae]|uniref:Beta-lactamase family protein n=1 Tax=Tardiphaga robiniae TaxID=943830 RepID=A0A7G6TYP2_9BRAD|nr:beta-lactamase family protein [Tardiphaga robiniae]
MNAQTAAKHAVSLETPELPQARPETLGLSSNRLQIMSDAFKREIDKGTTPGVTMLVSRRGQIGYFEAFGKQSPDGATAMSKDSLFRIFSMTKPIVSLGIMQLVEDGHILLNDPLAKYIPEFAETKVGVERNGALELALPLRPITIQDLLRHTSGISYEITGNGMVQRMYQKSNLRNRDITNEEHAKIVAGLPLICQPGSEWNYSRSTDILGRVIEVVSGKSLGNYLTENILAPLQMAETGFHTASTNKDRIAQPFPTDPWTGEKVALFDPLEIPEDGIRRRRPRIKDHGLCTLLPDAAQWRHVGRQPRDRQPHAASDGVQPSDAQREAGNTSRPARPRLRPRLRGAHRRWAGTLRGIERAILLERRRRHVLLDRSAGRTLRGVHVAGPRPAGIFQDADPESRLRGGGVTT